MRDAFIADATASLKRNGKTFWLGSLFLPKEMAAEAATLYAFCRRMDDLADQQGGFEAADRLQRVREDLHAGNSEEPVVLGLIQLAERRGLDLAAAQCLLNTLLRDAAGHLCIEDETELLEYCYGAAGTVGLMMSAVLQTSGSGAMVQAIDLGIAMQLTNIARDVRQDALMGRRYLPALWVRRMEPEQIGAATLGTESALHIKLAIEKILALADVFYASGARGFSAIPSAARNGIRIAAAVYRHIGVELRMHGCDSTRGRVVVSLPTKLTIAAAVLAGYSDLERLSCAGKMEALHGALVGFPGFG